MSRKSRRKTLSHAEIENFLCDLNDDEAEGAIKRNSLSGVVVKMPSPSSSSPLDSDCENRMLDVDSSSDQQSRSLKEKEDEARKYRASVVRAFHKDYATMSPTDATSLNMNECAKIIHEDTQYPLLPTRQIYPENYQHAITSLESKKALLMSMQPMLSAAEKQRKIDSDLLEKFTRCKVGKSRVRSSTYEYLDFDTNLRISGKEYSRRYLLYLSKKKTLEAGASPPPFSVISVQNSADSSESSLAEETIAAVEKPKLHNQKNIGVLQDISLSVSNSNNNSSAFAAGENVSSKKPVSVVVKKAAVEASAISSDLDFLMSFDDDDEDDDEASCRVVKPSKSSKGRHPIPIQSTHQEQQEQEGNSSASSRRRQDRSRSRLAAPSSSSRRRTLSPASTKAILQQEIEDNYSLLMNDINNNTEGDNDKCISSADSQMDMDGGEQQHVQQSEQEQLSAVNCRKRSLLQPDTHDAIDTTKTERDSVDTCSSSSGSSVRRKERDWGEVLASPMKVQIVQRDSNPCNTQMMCGISCDLLVSDPFADLPLPPAVGGAGEITFLQTEQDQRKEELAMEVDIERTEKIMVDGEVEKQRKTHSVEENIAAIALASSPSLCPDILGEQQQSVCEQQEHEDVEEEQDPEERARERYEVRLEVAKWKYFWEVASIDAARAASALRARR